MIEHIAHTDLTNNELEKFLLDRAIHEIDDDETYSSHSTYCNHLSNQHSGERKIKITIIVEDYE